MGARVGMGRGTLTGPQLMALRTRKGWTREELARELGVTYSTIYRWERGLVEISRPMERALRATLDGQR